MTEVEKVSIGGYAFTLEVEAYAIVKEYLDELSSHYASQEGGAEIMEGIEERMAELLYEKCADDGVASVSEVQEIIGILGKPSAIEADDEPGPKASTAGQPGKAKEKKRLYRDPTNKILGGVCSGLAAYFKCDVVIVRIIFIGLWLLFGVLHWRIGSHHLNIGSDASIPLLYIILWIAMPAARTVQQRWEMGVTNPPAGGQPAGSGLGRVLCVIIGCVLLLLGVAGMTFGLAAIFGRSLFEWDIIRESWDAMTENVPDILPLLGSFVFKADLIALYFLPMLGMLYGGIMMVFDLKSPSWRPGLVIFLLWVVALVVFIVLTLMGVFHAGLLC
ncbi:MAG: PspC domain-containing protein [Bacteroidales bacterium]|nr:PspC domain-containing protein [Bacteroidales bacterium]